MTERAENDLVFGILTSGGYFFIIIVLMIGHIMGDMQKITVFHTFLQSKPYFLTFNTFKRDYSPQLTCTSLAKDQTGNLRP